MSCQSTTVGELALAFAQKEKMRTAKQVNHQVSRLCRRLALDLLRRNPRKYGRIVAAIFAGQRGIERWRVRLIRVAYLYFRWLDDVADGDRIFRTGAKSLLDQQSAKWRGDVLDYDPTNEIDLLFTFLWSELEERTFPLNRVRLFALSIIQGLQLDLERRLKRKRFCQTELEDYYNRVVLAPAQLAHTILGAQAAPGALREISILIGRLQSARDLESDLELGLINVPLEDLDGLTQPTETFLPSRIYAWRVREVERCADQLRAIWKRWPQLADDRSLALLQPTVKTLLRWASAQSRVCEPIVMRKPGVLAQC